MRYLDIACRVLIGLLFFTSVVGKAATRSRFNRFRADLRAMRVVPARLAGPVAAAVCAGEAAVVPLLIFHATAAAGLLFAAGLLTAFGVAIAVLVSRRTDAYCRCFGFGAQRFGVRHLVRNAALTAACVAGVVALAVGQADQPDPAHLLPAAMSGALLAAVTVVLDDLLFLLRRQG
jgi:hypothetical protein